MPATDLSDAVRIAERLNAAVSTLPPEMEKHFSVSIGVAEYEPEQSGDPDVNQFIRSADRALYRAKERGKDGICYEGRLPSADTMTSVSSDEKTALLGSQNDE
jgi:diguanylate cyclase (GGDEF)-like protein